jgi:hypothetical protein
MNVAPLVVQSDLGFPILSSPSGVSEDKYYKGDTDTIDANTALTYILALIRWSVDAGLRTLSGYGRKGSLRCSEAPSTTKTWPEMKLAASLNRKTVALAISLESPMRPTGMSQ